MQVALSRSEPPRDILRFLFGFIRPYRRRYALGLALVPISIAANLAVPYLTGEATEQLELGEWEAGGFLMVLLAILAMAVVRSVTLLGMRYWIITASRDMEFDLRNRVFGHLQALDQPYYKAARTGDLLTRLGSDVERARVIAGPVVMYTASTFFMLAFALPLMLSLSWMLTCLLMVPLCLLTVAVRQIGPRVHERVFRAQEALSSLSSSAQENFAGVRVVKSFALEDHEIDRFAETSRHYMREGLGAARLAAWMQPIVGGVNDLSVLAILAVGGLALVFGELKFSEFIKFSGYQMQMIWPMISIGWVINQFQRGSASVRRLRELLDASPQVRPPATPKTPAGGEITGSISIRNLTFSYRDDQPPVLCDVSLEVEAGQTVAIVGRTGAGKSTLVNLIPRTYPVPPDSIFIDGVDINDLPLRLLRGSIGVVPQESFLFSRSLKANIAFAADDPDDQDIFGVAEVTRLDKDVDQFPHGYDEIVGERGVTLSGGQKQRTALARALLVRPRILILDDALSAVDTNTEEEILHNLRARTREMTTLVVSHRLSSIKDADRIYVLEDGRIVEQGHHDELLRSKGVYAEIYRLQLISDELERL